MRRTNVHIRRRHRHSRDACIILEQRTVAVAEAGTSRVRYRYSVDVLPVGGGAIRYAAQTGGGRRSGVGGSAGDASLPLTAYILVRGETEAGDVAVKEAKVDEENRGDRREEADDGDEDEGASAGHRQRWCCRGVAHARPVLTIAPRPVVDVDEHQLAQGERGDRERDDERRREANEKRRVVTAADAVVQPLAMMVEARYALVADGAVLCAPTARRYVAEVTPAVLDHVLVPRAIELGHNCAGRPGADLRVGRVQQQHRQVGQHVQQEQRGEQ